MNFKSKPSFGGGGVSLSKNGITLYSAKKEKSIFSLNKMAITSDEIVMLKQCDLPLMSFSYIIEAASPCCGKTYQMMKMSDAYINQAEKTKYDLDNPQILNGPIDLVYYISPSSKSDMTLLKNKTKKIEIEGTKENLLNLVEIIFKMRDDITAVIEM